MVSSVCMVQIASLKPIEFKPEPAKPSHVCVNSRQCPTRSSASLANSPWRRPARDFPCADSGFKWLKAQASCQLAVAADSRRTKIGHASHKQDLFTALLPRKMTWDSKINSFSVCSVSGGMVMSWSLAPSKNSALCRFARARHTHVFQKVTLSKRLRRHFLHFEFARVPV